MNERRYGPIRATRCKIEGCQQPRYEQCDYRLCEQHYLEYQRQAWRKRYVPKRKQKAS